MSPLPDRVRTFLRELKRRRVMRVGVAYAAAAFIAIEAAGNVLPPLGLEPLVRVVVVVCLLGFPAAVTLSWVFDLEPGGIVRTEAARMESRPLPNSLSLDRLDPKAVAVLPFDNLGGEGDDDYFSDGVTEEIISSLSRVAGLRMVSRTSVMPYKGAKGNVRRIGVELGAGSVLDGSVRRAGGRVRITAQLVDARSDELLWSERYDRALQDIFAIQTDVAERIVDALEAELSAEERERLGREPTDDLEAYDEYLKGRFLWNQRTEAGLRRSVTHLTQAIQIDPLFALAHAGLADTHVALALYNVEPPTRVMPRARSSARKALSLDPTMGEALTAAACVRAIFDWDWEGAEADFVRAIEANPRYPTAHQWYAMNHLAPQGRFDEARESLERALALDPRSPVLEASRGFLLYLERRYEDAVPVYRQILTADPDFALAHLFLGQALQQMADHEGAIEALERAASARGRPPEMLALLGQAHVGGGHLDRARGLLDELESLSERVYVSPGRRAELHLALGQFEAGFSRFAEAVEVRATDLIWLRVMPTFDDVRADERFQSLLAGLGLRA